MYSVPLTIRVMNTELGDVAASRVEVVGPAEYGNSTLHESHAAGKVERSIPIAITDQWVGICSEGEVWSQGK